MAIRKCHYHRPKSSHYRTYAQPLAYLELQCDMEGCTQPVSIWLNPEEVRDYERGSRLFYDDRFDVLKVDSRGLKISPRRFRISFRSLRRARDTRRTLKPQRKFKT